MTTAVTLGSRERGDLPHTGERTYLFQGNTLAPMGGSGTESVMGTPGEHLLDQWARRMRAEGLAERTIIERPRIVRRAAAYADTDAHQLTEDQLVDYLADLPTAATKQTYFGALRAWHRWLVDRGRRADDPMASLRRPRAPRRRAHPVSTSHIDVVLGSGIRGRTRTAVLLCSLQGLRVHEAAKIRGEDIDLIAQRLRVVGKGGVDVWMPLHPLIAAEAERYPRRGYWFPSHTRPGRPVRRESLSAVISRAMRRAGVPGTAHSLRHWMGTELLNAGRNARETQELLRHASLATLQVYTLITHEQQAAALLALPTPRVPPRPTHRLAGIHRSAS